MVEDSDLDDSHRCMAHQYRLFITLLTSGFIVVTECHIVGEGANMTSMSHILGVIVLVCTAAPTIVMGTRESHLHRPGVRTCTCTCTCNLLAAKFSLPGVVGSHF
jgi:hypothetical protein